MGKYLVLVNFHIIATTKIPCSNEEASILRSGLVMSCPTIPTVTVIYVWGSQLPTNLKSQKTWKNKVENQELVFKC